VIVPADESDASTAGNAIAAGAGGLVLFGASAPADLGAHLAALRKLVPGGLGLLVMTDEEGGGVQRMANLVGSLPWASTMGASWSPAEITAQVTAVARRMAADGVNVDLAPVADVDGRDEPPGAHNPDGWRSFSGSPSVAGADAAAFAAGLTAGGVMPVVKHFPGLGGSNANTDDGTADTLPWSKLQQQGLPPFEQAIRAGVPAIMVSNAIVPGLTTIPASLSPAAVAGALEGTLGFHGLVITDSLSALAIPDAGYSLPAASVQALRAGEDMVMFTQPFDASGVASQLQAIVSAVEAAVAGGTLARSRLQAAAAAVLAADRVHVCS
jgi:beta-N-acetylhexosaminidase